MKDMKQIAIDILKGGSNKSYLLHGVLSAVKHCDGDENVVKVLSDTVKNLAEKVDILVDDNVRIRANSAVVKMNILAEYELMQQTEGERPVVYITVAKDGDLVLPPHYERFDSEDEAIEFTKRFNSAKFSAEDVFSGIKKCVERVKGEK